MAQRGFYNRFNVPDSSEYYTHVDKNNPSRCVQSYKDDVCIHSIVARGMNSLPKRTAQPSYGVNLKEVGDLQTKLSSVSEAKNFFNSLPDELVDRFDNSPEKFVEFISDPKNHDEGVKLGLFNPEKPNVFERSVERIADLLSGNQQKTGEKPVVSNDTAGQSNPAGSAPST